MTEQLTLGLPGADAPPEKTAAVLEFERFHRDNPRVLDELVRVTREAVALGFKTCGIRELYERLRWEGRVVTDALPYQLNNNFHSYYARVLLRLLRLPDGFFETRRLPSAPGGEYDPDWTALGIDPRAFEETP